eukprot:GHVS01030699.1.p1 GENE.GHVS01030699.1~~GHVS01030699.1.p1  ORF type:complete len:719 (+),score=88.88 GHVS01030699.1:555-2711(+)
MLLCSPPPQEPWNLWQKRFMPWEMDFTRLNHVLYGFFQINRECQIESASAADTFVDFDLLLEPLGMADEAYSGPKGLVGAFQILRGWAEDNGFGFKLIVSIGGDKNSGFYSRCADDVYRDVLVANVAEFVREHDFDGVHFDWQYPNEAEDYSKLLNLVKETKDTLGSIFSVSIEQGMSAKNIDDADGLISYSADFVLVHAYDYHGYSPLDPVTGINAPVRQAAVGDITDNIHYGIGALIFKGFKRDKLVLGISACGKCWSGVPAGPNSDGLFQQGYAACLGTNKPGEVKYYDMPENYSEFASFWDEHSQTPYAFKDNVFVSYDDERSVLIKGIFAKQRDFAGICLSQAVDDLHIDERDDVQLLHGLGGVKEYALLSSALAGWRGQWPKVTSEQISFLGHRLAGNANSEFVLATGVAVNVLLNINVADHMHQQELDSGEAWGDVQGVFVYGNIAAVGCIHCGVGGKVFVFDLSSNSLMFSVEAPTPEVGGDFGMSVGIFRNSLIVGAPGTTVYGLPKAGSVFVFSATTGHPNGNAGTRLPRMTENGRFGTWLTTSQDHLYIRMEGGGSTGGEVHQYVTRGPGVFPSGMVMSNPADAQPNFGTKMAGGGNILALCGDDAVISGGSLCAAYGTNSPTAISQWSVEDRVEDLAVNAESMQVIVGVDGGRALGFDVATGQQLWAYSSPVATFGYSVAATATGHVGVGAPVTNSVYFIDPVTTP